MTEIIPDYIEPIVAWREWYFLQSGELCSTFRYVVWPSKQPIKAECPKETEMGIFLPSGEIRNHQTEAPAPGCVCGIYARTTNDEILKRVKNVVESVGLEQEKHILSCWETPMLPMLSFGQVYLWGKIQEHEVGYRAQFAYPKEIWIPSLWIEVASRIEDHYAIPVGTWEGFLAKLNGR